MSQAPHPVTVYRSPSPRRFQALWVGLAILALFPGIAAAVLWLIPPGDSQGAVMASFIPYGMLADLIALICSTIALFRARNRIATGALVAFSSLLLILQLSWIGPQFVADDRPVRTPSFTLLSLNLQYGSADLDQLARQSRDVDVVNLVEATPESYAEIRDRLGDRFRYVTPPVPADSNESMVLSRYPLSEVRRLESVLPQLSMAVDIPQLGTVNLVSAHPCNPFCGGDYWAEEHQQLLQRAESLPNRPTIIAGDFNAVADHRPMRRLEQQGFRSATDVAGAGWQPTFPANRRFPPLIQIDHVMIDDRLTATMIDTIRIDGTDHLGLRAEIAGTR